MFETSRLMLTVANRTLCRDMSVRFAPGENWVILGANGSGKTTLLHALAGLRPPAGGEVRLDDKPYAVSYEVNGVSVCGGPLNSGFYAWTINFSYGQKVKIRYALRSGALAPWTSRPG